MKYVIVIIYIYIKIFFYRKHNMVFLLVLLTFLIGSSISYYVQRKKGEDSMAQLKKGQGDIQTDD